MITLGILGGIGKMGRLLSQHALHHPEIDLKAVGYHRTSPPLDLKYLPFKSSLNEIFESCDLIIDFTQPDALISHLEKALAYKKPIVIGTTGLTEDHFSSLQQTGREIPLLYSTNMSLGISLLNEMVEYLAEKLDKTYDIEILEAHHRDKKDAPSGTALTLGRSAAKGRGLTFQDHFCFHREKNFEARRSGDIGFASLRAGQIIGDHQVMFASNDEIITLSHHSLNRDIFAKGALQAALWLYSQPPGLYSIKDILNNPLTL